MRARGSLLILCLVSLGANYAFAQAAEDPPLQFDPYNKHHDRHLGHDHVYPDRGSVFRDAPKGSIVVNYAGLAYRFYNGVWFEPRGPAYIVVMPPIGVVVPTLPGFVTSFESSGETYLYANETYYLPRPDLGGYEVVNDPADSVQTSAAKAGMRLVKPSPGGAVMPGAVVPAVATVSVAPTPAAPPVSGAQQIASIPTNPEETADAEVKAYSYAPTTVSAQSGQNSVANASAAQKHSEVPAAAGAVIAPAMAGAALAAAPTVAGTQAVAAAPAGAGSGAIVAAPRTSWPQVASATAAPGPAAVAPVPAVASNATVATTPAVGTPPPAPTPGNNLAATAPQVTGSAITNVPGTAAAAPAALPTGAGATWSSPPSASESTPTTPRPSSAYTYTTPPTLETDPHSGSAPRTANATVATAPIATTPTTSAGSVTTVPAVASAATTAQIANASTGGATQTVSNTPNGGSVRFTASPRNGQSLDQQARDQYDCYRFGVAQTGFDPMNGSAPAAGKGSQADFDRARAACFEGRGYNVK